MVALCVDDEPIILQSLKNAAESSADVTEAFAFEDELDALDWAQNNQFDIAFVDIELHNMNGLELAQKLKDINDEVGIVLCTGHTRYAVDSYATHIIDGYLLKPITEDKLQREIDYIKNKEKPKKQKLKAKCFGNFELFFGDAPVEFKRKKTKELFAYLVDRNGAVMSAREICANLWEDSASDEKNLNYFRQLTKDLTDTLGRYNAQSVLIKKANGYALDTTRFSCDYYAYLNGDDIAKGSFLGEYMAQYSWAEITLASLIKRENGNF